MKGQLSKLNARVRSLPNGSLVLPLVVFCLLLLTQTGFADQLVIGNGAPTIETFNYTTGALVGSFFPDGGLIDGRGRAVEVIGNTVYYAAVSGDIHLAPFNGGAGGHDIGVIQNPRPAYGIQDLDYSGGVLYALTGYFAGAPVVYRLDPGDGHVFNSVAIQNHPDTAADGFTVLPNGDFLINDGDASAVYREYNSVTGAPTGLVITIPGGDATGVDYNPVDNSLYFLNQGTSPPYWNLTRTTLNGTIIDSTNIGYILEDISVLQPVPEPGSLVLLGSGLLGVGGLLRRRLNL